MASSKGYKCRKSCTLHSDKHLRIFQILIVCCAWSRINCRSLSMNHTDKTAPAETVYPQAVAPSTFNSPP